MSRWSQGGARTRCSSSPGRSRTGSRQDRRFVETLAGQAAQALDRASLFESEQTIAETLQRSVLPASLPRVEGVQLAARYLPGTAGVNVGGDWFDAIRLSDGQLGLVVGDVVGKGVQAAATMAQLRNALRAFALDRTKPSSTITRLNRLAEEMETAFATVAYVVVDADAGSAATRPPDTLLWQRFPDGRIELLEGGRGLPLGAGIDTKYRQERSSCPWGPFSSCTPTASSNGVVRRSTRVRAPPKRSARGPPGAAEARRASRRAPGRGHRTGDDMRSWRCVCLPLRRGRSTYAFRAIPTRSIFVRDALRSWLGGTELGRADVQDVVLAVWEVCANSIEHGASARAEVVVRAEMTTRGYGSRSTTRANGACRWNESTEGRGFG